MVANIVRRVNRISGVAIRVCTVFVSVVNKNWQQLIREGAQSTPVDPREAFMAAFVNEGRTIRVEKGDKPGQGAVIVENKLRKELVLTVNVSERAVAFRVFNTRFESYDCQGGSPDAYDAATLRNVVAYFYNIAVKGEKAPTKVNATDFAE